MATAALGAGRFGPFRLLERLPEDGPVERYHALWSEAQTPSERLCVLRRLPVELTGSQPFSRMFAEEARIMGRLCHPNIVRAYAAGEIEGAPYLALEYLDGVSVAQLVAIRRGQRQRLPLEVAVFIIHEVASALGYAYDATDESGHPLQLVHGDLRPGVVAILGTGEVKLTELGATRVVSFVHGKTSGGASGGKPLHAAPELLAGAQPDARSDLFSLGVLLWELVCNQPLFPSTTSVREAAVVRASRIRGDLPPALDGLILQLLERNPARRRTSAEEVRRALAPFIPSPADAERALAAMIRESAPMRGMIPAPRAERSRPGAAARRPVTLVVPNLAARLRARGGQLARALPGSIRRVTGLLSPLPGKRAPAPVRPTPAPAPRPARLARKTPAPATTLPAARAPSRLRSQVPRLGMQGAMAALLAFLVGMVWQELRSSGSAQLVQSEGSPQAGVLIEPLAGPSELVAVEPVIPLPALESARPSVSARPPVPRPHKTAGHARTRSARSARATAH